MIMSHFERHLPVTTTTENSSIQSSSIALRQQESIITDQHKQSYSAPRQGVSPPPASSKSQQLINTMAMQNMGPNPLPQEHQEQLKHTPPNTVNETCHNSMNDNPADSRQSTTSATISSNNNNNNIDIDNNQKLPQSDNALTSANRSLNRTQYHQPNSQSQQYHGIFSPQIPASLQSSLASRVDQIIRTTLHDSPAYTPPTSKNSNTPTSSNNNSTTPNSNMPSPSSSSSLIFNPPSNMMATTVSSALTNISAHPPNSSGGPIATTASPLTSIYGPSSLSASSDMSANSGANSNLLTKTSAHSSASHSALAAAAALQSLNQSHIQRSQQLAHTQQAPFLNAAPPTTTKPPSNTSGTSVPQAAHGNSTSNHTPTICITNPMANADHHKHTAFTSDRPDNSGDFSSRMQTNNASNTGNKMPSQTSSLAHLPLNWQEHARNSNGSMPRMMPAHSNNNTMAPFASSPNPYALIGHSLSAGLNASNSSTMIGQDGDNMSRLNVLRSSSGNITQLHDDKNFMSNFPNPLVKQALPTSFDGMRGPHSSLSNDELRVPPQISGLDVHERITEEKLAIFAYNLLSAALPGTNRCKKIIHMDDEMRDSVHNGEFYTKYDHIATGILTNTILVPNFSIIDYLRRDRFSFREVERIEGVNRKLSLSNFACLMELVRQRPFVPMASKPPSEMDTTRPPFTDSMPVTLGTNLHFQYENAPGASQGGFMRGGNQLISSSPNRNETGDPQGMDKPHRSSQSPSDISRSHMGSTVNNMKFLNSQNQYAQNPHNPPHSSPLGYNQFGSSSCPVNQQKNHQQLSLPQSSRSSPFQQPISVCPQSMSRPPRSHSTIGGLNVSSLNTPLNSSMIRQPPAAHQSSSRPNLAALVNEMSPAHAHSATIPVTAHMSSKTPQTPRLPESLISLQPLPTKTSPSTPGSFMNKQLGSGESLHQDFSNQSGRPELESIHGLPIQTLLSLRQQEINNREQATKRSMTQYPPPPMSNMGPLSNLSSLEASRQAIMENQHVLITHNLPQSNAQHNNPLGLANIAAHRNSNFPNASLAPQFNPSMPPPTSSADHQRQINNDSCRGSAISNMPAPNTSANESHINQYNSLMAAYQKQQIILSNKLIDNGPGALPPSNMTSRSSIQIPSSNQSELQHANMREPISVDTIPTKQPQSQTSSPKSNNQRSIITGSASSGSKKSKKAKISPPTANQLSDDKISIESSDHASLPKEKSSMADMNIPASHHQNAPTDVEASLVAISATSNMQHDASTQPRGPDCLPESAFPDSKSTRSTFQESIDHVNNFRPINTPSGNALLPNISNQSITTGERPLNDSNSLNPESKPLTSSNDTNAQNRESDPPSKYQKIFTKKAWLKNYGEEDQARMNEVSNPLDDKVSNQTITVEVKVDPQPPPVDTIDDSTDPTNKPNGSSKNSKASKSDNKKKIKEVKTKKASSTEAAKPSRLSNKSTDNDSEDTTATTSDPDDTDETDSIKSGDKKLRRMPRRKAKSNPDRESTDQAIKDAKAKTNKDPKEKDAARKRSKKDKPVPEVQTVKRKCNSDDESINKKVKKIKDEGSDKTDSASQKAKKRIGEKFLQTQPCYEIVPKTIRCLECRRVRQSSFKAGEKATQSKQSSKSHWDDFCRFFEFRKLRYNKAGQIVVAGFSDSTDAKDFDKKLWLPSEDKVPTNITYKVAKYILENIGDEFCRLVLQERSVIESYEAKSGDKRTTWKRAVNGLRELCDVCSTTLFNCHYVCERCGFVVCIDCHQSRADNHEDQKVDNSIKKEAGDSGDNSYDVTDPPTVTNKKSKKDSFGWIFCAKNEEHSHRDLALAKIIAGDCLEEVWSLLHDARRRLRLKPCSCTSSAKLISDGRDIDQLPDHEAEIKSESKTPLGEGLSTLKGLLLASNDSALNGPVSQGDKIAHLCQMNHSVDGQHHDSAFDFVNEGTSQDDSEQVSAAIEGCIASLNIDWKDRMQEELAEKVDAEQITTHLRLCEGDLLVLTHARHKYNTKLFREHWKQGKPVLVRDIHKKMNIDMWLPQFFSGEFGDYRSDLVDCRNGDIHRQSMRKYWDGFEPNPAKKRVKEDNIPCHIPSANNEEPSAVSTSYYSGSALWRLKDWPPGQDFNEILPEHYDDFMNNLPLSSYTTRTGKLNLACRLPKEMVKPDLGPKMYSAYGTTKFPERGTTNLHLDISDAVNVMVYVGGATPFNQGSMDYAETYEKTIDECRVDNLMKAQIREQKLIPGALWHIFRPCDVNKMRVFLNQVSDECKISPEKRNDPIHDQIWYLDQTLLDRLYKEHGVKSYPVLQCMGDAILIPAGSPHQVKNLQNCIKVANDFVSPENVRHCLQLTNEFRNLPETHINQEDKLQIKNILYHSVKESIQYIDMYESGKVSLKDESCDEDDCCEPNEG